MSEVSNPNDEKIHEIMTEEQVKTMMENKNGKWMLSYRFLAEVLVVLMMISLGITIWYQNRSHEKFIDQIIKDNKFMWNGKVYVINPTELSLEQRVFRLEVPLQVIEVVKEVLVENTKIQKVDVVKEVPIENTKIQKVDVVKEIPIENTKIEKVDVVKEVSVTKPSEETVKTPTDEIKPEAQPSTIKPANKTMLDEMSEATANRLATKAAEKEITNPLKKAIYERTKQDYRLFKEKPEDSFVMKLLNAAKESQNGAELNTKLEADRPLVFNSVFIENKAKLQTNEDVKMFVDGFLDAINVMAK